jgi:hypothetical protein
VTRFLLDTHEYDGVSVLKCGPEYGCFLLIVSLILFDQSVREGLIRFPPFSGYKNNMESGAHSQLPI